ncbi:MAG: hypothetical protein A2138_26895 [Deltaproteobacteria bacterium RBG_16_71_12]|nr:MAG: hypothetical protein A2138_26895 [Deltaproteobacteria bacterium RBG_16_71_12]
MKVFLQIFFGVVAALVTVFMAYHGLRAVAYEEWDIARSFVVVWGLMAGAVVVLWALWSFGCWLVRRLRRA